MSSENINGGRQPDIPSSRNKLHLPYRMHNGVIWALRVIAPMLILSACSTPQNEKRSPEEILQSLSREVNFTGFPPQPHPETVNNNEDFIKITMRACIERPEWPDGLCDHPTDMSLEGVGFVVTLPSGEVRLLKSDEYGFAELNARKTQKAELNTITNEQGYLDEPVYGSLSWLNITTPDGIKYSVCMKKPEVRPTGAGYGYVIDLAYSSSQCEPPYPAPNVEI